MKKINYSKFKYALANPIYSNLILFIYIRITQKELV